MQSRLTFGLVSIIALVIAVQGGGASNTVTSSVPPTPNILAVAVGKTTPEKLGRFVIMLTGADAVQTRLLEESLALQLLKRRESVVSRLRVERLLAEEMLKYRGTTENDSRKAIHATVIAKNAGAGAILIGTLYNETRSAGLPADKNDAVRLFRCVSLQLISVENEEILWTACAEFDDSISYNDLAKQLTERIGKE